MNFSEAIDIRVLLHPVLYISGEMGPVPVFVPDSDYN